MTQIQVKVHGGKEMLKALKDLGSEVAGQRGGLVKTALMAAALPVLRSAQANVPVKTGRLKRAIKRQRHPNPRVLNEIVGVGVDQGTKRSDTTGAFYGSIVEFRKPFLRPALETNRTKSVGILGKKLGSGIEKIAKKIGNENAQAVGAKFK